MDCSNFIKDRSATKLHKNVAIAKSGIYQYHISELSGLFDGKVEVPDEHKTRTVFNVYRPPEVLRDAKSLFVQLPLTREHPDDFVTPENIRSSDVEWIGWTGDSSKIVLVEDEKDVTINSTLNIVDKLGINSYDSGVIEVSPGYVADFMWKDGVDKNGTPFQIVMTKINEVNHLALVDQGRGGKDASILDSKKENTMDEKTILGFIKKSLDGLFSKPAKVLDSMPKDIEKFTDEQKDYLLKETHRLLQHRVSGKTFDSFLPLGYTKDELPNMEESKAEDSVEEKTEDSESEAHEKIAEGLKEDIKADEEEKKAEDSVEETDGEVEDAEGVEKKTPPLDTTPGADVEGSQKPQAKDHDMTVKVSDSKATDSVNDPFAVMADIKNGFKKTAKKETK